MIYLITALYSEAKPFIQFLNLKKEQKSHKIQIFRNEEVILCITGVGVIAAAIGTNYVLTVNQPDKKDILVNIGICGSSNRDLELGTIILGNQILEQETKRSFYPDILFPHPFLEGTIQTCFQEIQKEEKENKLVDMEASGIYQAAKLFFQPHQLIFLKIISDYLDTKEVDKEKVMQLIEKKVKIIINWCYNAEKILQDTQDFSFTEREKERINEVSSCLKLSVSMKYNLSQLLYYYKLKTGEIETLINKFLQQENLLQNGEKISCNSKREGKLYLEKLKNSLRIFS